MTGPRAVVADTVIIIAIKIVVVAIAGRSSVDFPGKRIGEMSVVLAFTGFCLKSLRRTGFGSFPQ